VAGRPQEQAGHRWMILAALDMEPAGDGAAGLHLRMPWRCRLARSSWQMPQGIAVFYA